LAWAATDLTNDAEIASAPSKWVNFFTIASRSDPLSFGGVAAHSVIDVGAGQTEVRQRSVVEGHQLNGGTMQSTPVLKPSVQLKSAAKERTADSPSGFMLSIEWKDSMQVCEVLLDHDGFS
jgi:hypothetical protein